MGRKKKKRSLLLRLICRLILAGVICFTGLVGFVVVREKSVESGAAALEKDYDAIIVLGAQILLSGEPNTQLEWRLDAAFEAWSLKQVPVVVCGAQGHDEPMPEATAMKNYLVRKGIPAEMIYEDPASYNTNQNLRNAAEILDRLTRIRKVLIVTSDYHVARAMALAGDLGFEAAGLGSPCKPEYWLKNHTREALAWVKYWAVKYLHLQL